MHRTPTIQTLLVILVALLPVACATRPAPDVAGRWQPLNHYAPTAQPIPLRSAYVFAPSLLDGTLKSMLERWAADTHRTVSYQLASDFTLPEAVEQVRSTDLETALGALNTVFAPQHLVVSVGADLITVSRLPQEPPPADPGS